MQIGVEYSRSVENKRIFVIENDEITRAALQFMLHDENETHELASIAEALAKGAGWTPDLVLLGAAILRQQGDGSLAELKQAWPQVKILIIQGDEPASVGWAQANGAITKPLTVENVRRQVDIALGRVAPPPLVSLNVLG